MTWGEKKEKGKEGKGGKERKELQERKERKEERELQRIAHFDQCAGNRSWVAKGDVLVLWAGVNFPPTPILLPLNPLRQGGCFSFAKSMGFKTTNVVLYIAG